MLLSRSTATSWASNRSGGSPTAAWPGSPSQRRPTAGSRTELVLHNKPHIPPLDVNYTVEDVPAAVAELVAAGCRVIAGPFPIAIGNCAVIADPFGNPLTLVDTTRGLRQNNLA